MAFGAGFFWDLGIFRAEDIEWYVCIHGRSGYGGCRYSGGGDMGDIYWHSGEEVGYIYQDGGTLIR